MKQDNKQDTSNFIASVFAEAKPLREERDRLQRDANKKAHQKNPSRRTSANVHAIHIDGMREIKATYASLFEKLEEPTITPCHLQALEAQKQKTLNKLIPLDKLQSDGNIQMQDLKQDLENQKNNTDDYVELLASGYFDEAEELNTKSSQRLDKLADAIQKLEKQLSAYPHAKQLIEFDISIYDEMKKKITRNLSTQFYEEKSEEFIDKFEALKDCYFECDALAQELNLNRKQYNQIADLLNMRGEMTREHNLGLFVGNNLRSELGWDKSLS